MRRSDSRRAQRLGDLIMREVASMLAVETADPRLELVTISGVRMNSDLSVAEVLYSAAGDAKRMEEISRALQKASGFFRGKLGKRLKIKKVPELRFLHDEFLEKMVYDESQKND